MSEILQVLEWPNSILETRAHFVAEFDDELRSFVNNMLTTMNAARGIGLAANQVGALKRVLTIHIPTVAQEDGSHKKNAATRNAPYHWENQTFVMINPVITKREGKIKYEEGCLSFPELYEEVERFKRIEVDYQDETGQKHSIHAEDLFAICIQHEIDHLDGVVFVNRLVGRECQRAKNRYQTLQEKRHAKPLKNIAIPSDR